MSKKYDARLVEAYRSYSIKDICRLFRGKKLHEQTVRKWINAGELKAFLDGKVLYVYGAVLKQFMASRNAERKSLMEFNQFRCWKCTHIGTPQHAHITTLTTGRNECLLAIGVCAACGHAIKRFYKANTLQKLLDVFTVGCNELGRLSDSSCSTGKTHIDEYAKTAISEPVSITPPHTPIKTTCTTGNTHQKRIKNTTSTGTTQCAPVQLNLFEATAP